MKFMSKFRNLLVAFGLTLTLVGTMVMPAFASTENENQLETIYENIYEQCKTQNVTQITDEYSAYSYLLNNKQVVTVNQGKFQTNIEAMDIDSNQLSILNTFIEKIDNLVDLNVLTGFSKKSPASKAVG